MPEEPEQDLATTTGIRVLIVTVDENGQISWDGDEAFPSPDLARIAWVLERLAQDQWKEEQEEDE